MGRENGAIAGPSTEAVDGEEKKAINNGKVGSLACEYTCIADDAGRSEKEREASLLFSVAESALDGEPEDLEELEEIVEAANRAKLLFQELGDGLGAARARRLLAHARRRRPAAAEALAAATAEVVPEISQQAALVEDAFDALRADEHSYAVSFLATAERRLREECAAEARAAAEAAVPLLRRLGDASATARAVRVRVLALRHDQKEELAEELAREELERFREREHAHGEAAMLICLAELRSGRGVDGSEEALNAAAEAQEISQSLGVASLEGAALAVLASTYSALGNFKESMRAASDAVILFRGLGDTEGEVKALQELSLAYRRLDRLPDALRWATIAGESARKLGPCKALVAQLCLDAELQREAQDFGGMLREARKAMGVAQSCNLHREETEALALAVQALICQGQPREALAMAQSSLQRFQALSHTRAQAAALDLEGQCSLELQDTAGALCSAQAALELIRQLGDKQWESRVLQRVSCAELRERKLAEASQTAQDAISLMRDLGDGQGEALTRLHTLVEVHMENEEWEPALEALCPALQLLRELGDREREVYALCSAACANLQLGRLEQATENAEKAQALAEELTDLGMGAEALRVQSQVSLARGKFREAARQAEDALTMVRRSKEKKSQREMGLLLHLNYIQHSAVLSFRSEGGSAESRAYRDLVAKVDRGAAAALKLAAELGDQQLLAIAKFRSAQASLLSGRFREALEANDTAMAAFHELGDRHSEGGCAVVKSQVLQAFGQLQEALQLAQSAEAIGQGCGDEALELEARSQIAVITQELEAAQGTCW